MLETVTMVQVIAEYLPNWVKEKGLFPPVNFNIDLDSIDYLKCWIAQNTKNFTLQIMRDNKPYNLRREIIKLYFDTNLENTRVIPCSQHPLCLNPNHLKIKRLKQKPKTKKGLNGEHGNAKLSYQQVEEIRHLLFSTEMSLKEIAKRYGVSSQNISHILCEKSLKKSKKPS
jgi:predicted DNA-binding protein (UPF0251 family)